ncbi:MAG: PA0069 family radical SAM protein [Gemmataceae bacterium]
MVDVFKGRGARINPTNRFETLRYDLPMVDDDSVRPATQLFRDQTRSFITYNDSPDVGCDATINPYRGCEHGCVYCYARPNHEYLGWSAGLDFETRLLVKENAPELLRKELSSPRWQPQCLMMSGITDCYQPIERHLLLTRRCLEVLAQFRNPVHIVTKNRLITRDADLLAELAGFRAAACFLSVTTLDAELQQRLEPRASAPQARLEAVRELAERGIPTGVMIAPVIPGLTDHAIPAILAAARDAGAQFAGYVSLRLPFGVKGLFLDWLDRHYPEKKDKVLARVREIRGGKLNDSRFGDRMRGEGLFAEMVNGVFKVSCRKLGLTRAPELSSAAFRRPGLEPLFASLAD